MLLIFLIAFTCVGANVGNLTQHLQSVEDKAATHVGFHARMTHGKELNKTDHVKFDELFYNSSRDYDSRTGVFTAPQSGSYFFTVTVSPFSEGNYSNCVLVHDGSYVAWAGSKYTGFINPATMHAVLHLAKGSKVWVESWVNDRQYQSWSLFSGFLVHLDW